MNPGHSANLVDVHVGGRIRSRRSALGQSHLDVAEMLGMTAEDVEAIENGGRRAGAEDLYNLARVLGVKVAFFFEFAAETDAAGRSGFEAPKLRAAQIAPL